MDTLTQALLGGAVGYAVAGRKAPHKAILVGAAIAVLPDLDIFIQHSNDLDTMTLHRSWTHSWIIQTLLAPLIALFISRFDKQLDFKTWWLITWLVLVTHAGLDALTVYGTQLFWPFMPPPASGGSVFIIDPVYSLPLFAGFLWVLRKPAQVSSHRLMIGALIFSTVYLGWGFGAQQWVKNEVLAELEKQQIEFDHLQVSAAPLNTLLWRVLVVSEDSYYEGFRSVFDGDAALILRGYPRGGLLQQQAASIPAVEQLDWFTRGLFKLSQHENQLIATDLRMGAEPHYFFRFQIAELEAGMWQEIEPEQLRTEREIKAGIQWTWRRIWSPEATLASESTTSAHFHADSDAALDPVHD